MRLHLLYEAPANKLAQDMFRHRPGARRPNWYSIKQENTILSNETNRQIKRDAGIYPKHWKFIGSGISSITYDIGYGLVAKITDDPEVVERAQKIKSLKSPLLPFIKTIVTLEDIPHALMQHNHTFYAIISKYYHSISSKYRRPLELLLQMGLTDYDYNSAHEYIDKVKARLVDIQPSKTIRIITKLIKHIEQHNMPQLDELIRYIRAAEKMGIAITDIHSGNFRLTPHGELVFIDYGGVTLTD